MNSSSPDHRLAELLAQRAWVQGVARSLTRDEASADDLEQETWLAAVERPPTWRSTPRGWLRGVLQRRAARTGRSGARRARRERAVARPEPLPATDDLLAGAEQHRLVVQAVWQLDEVHRTALLLRFYEGLPPREIARRTSAPVETVRARVRRALERLRQHFDQRHGGDRRAWMSALAPLLGGTGGLAPAGGSTGGTGSGAALEGALGGMLMATKGWMGITGVALLGLGAWWLSSRGADEPPRAPSAERASVDQTPPGLEGAGGPRSTGSGTPGPASTAEAGPARGAGLYVRWAGTGQRPAPGARVWIPAEEGPSWDLSADAVGWVASSAGAPAQAPLLFVSAPGCVPVRRERVNLASGTTVVELDAAVSPRLVFLDAGGRELEAGEVQRRYEEGGVALSAQWLWPESLAPATAAEALRLQLGGAAPWMLPAHVGLTAEGGAALSDAPPAARARLVVSTPSGIPWLSPPLMPGTPVQVPLATEQRRWLRLVAAEDGRALAGAVVVPYAEWGDDALFLRGTPRTADAQGRLELRVLDRVPRGRAASLLVEAPERTLWIVQGTDRLELPAGGDAVEVRVPRSATLEGRAYGPDGAPAAGATLVWVNRGLVRRARAGADGRYRLSGIAPWGGGFAVEAPRRVRVALLLAGAAEPVAWGQAQVRPGEQGSLDLGVPAGASGRAAVRGRVTHDGRGLAGVFVLLRPADAQGDDMVGPTTTADDGTFGFEGLPPGGYHLMVFLGNPRVSDDFALQSESLLALNAGETVTRDLRLPGGELRVTVLDATTGEPLPGAMVAVRPEQRGAGSVPGFRGSLGWSAFCDARGSAHLVALPPGEPHEVRVFAEGYAEGKLATVLPGLGSQPPDAVVRLERR